MRKYVPHGMRELNRIILKHRDFIVYYDPDVDGLMSGYLMTNFIKSIGGKSSYVINPNRGHGFKIPKSMWNQLLGKTLIVVDALMSRKEVQDLVDFGVDIINIDHHDIQEEKELVYCKGVNGAEGVIVNNQYCFEPKGWRFLSGAGMVYYVTDALKPGYASKDDAVLVGISLLSDVRAIENSRAKDFLTITYTHRRYLTSYLLDNTANNFDFGFGERTLDRNYIDFTLSPKLNALFRLNMGKTAIEFIHGKPLATVQDFDVYRDIQKAIVEEMTKGMKGKDYPGLSVRYVNDALPTKYPKFSRSNFIGLLCSQVKNNGNTSLVYLCDESGKIIRGSVRGNSDKVDYLNIFRKFGFKCEGHPNAFGVLTLPEQVDYAGLSEEIQRQEIILDKNRYDGRILRVSNMKMFIASPECRLADYNCYVREQNRLYIKYTGMRASIKKSQRGKCITYELDGVPVLCFDENLSIERDLIVALRERGKYLNFYLRKF